MSEIIVWEEKYSIGVDLIDNQHKQLIAYLNSYYKALSDGKAKDAVDRVLNGLTDYVGYHFSEEEKLMQSIQDVDFSLHFEEHCNFSSKVLTLKSKSYLDEDVSYELFDFMKDWVIAHFSITDQKFGKIYKDKFLL